MDNRNKHQLISLIFKLLHDVLAVMLLTFALFLIGESALTGLISSHVSFTKFSVLIFLFMVLIAWIGNYYHLYADSPHETKHRKLPLLLVFAFFLISNALLRFSLLMNLVVTITTLGIMVLLYQLLQEKK